MDIALLWPAALTLLLLAGAIGDIRDRRLPNWLALALLLLGLPHAYYLGGLGMTGWHFAHALIAMVVGAGIFAAGIMGGGDAKFCAGLAAFFPIERGVEPASLGFDRWDYLDLELDGVAARITLEETRRWQPARKVSLWRLDRHRRRIRCLDRFGRLIVECPRTHSQLTTT